MKLVQSSSQLRSLALFYERYDITVTTTNSKTVTWKLPKQKASYEIFHDVSGDSASVAIDAFVACFKQIENQGDLRFLIFPATEGRVLFSAEFYRDSETPHVIIANIFLEKKSDGNILDLIKGSLPTEDRTLSVSAA